MTKLMGVFSRLKTQSAIIFGDASEELAEQEADWVSPGTMGDIFWGSRGRGDQRTGSSHSSTALQIITLPSRILILHFFQSKPGMPNISYGAGNFGKIWSACGQHAIQHTI
jgi:hypothetical protein